MSFDDRLLTRKEYDIACLASKGMLRKEIAEIMGIKLKSVDNYLKNVYRKFNIHSKSALPAIFINNLSAHKISNEKISDIFDSICTELMTSLDLAKKSGLSRKQAYYYLKKRNMFVNSKHALKRKRKVDDSKGKC